jgi:hypothetical protein
MKPVFIILFISVYYCGLILGQDQLIRTNGDTIKCTVTKIDSNNIYFKVNSQHRMLETHLSKDKISEFNIPVLPNDPMRVLCERKIKNSKVWLTISSIAFVSGGVLTISGITGTTDSGGDVNVNPGGMTVTGDENTSEKAMNRIAAGIPLLAAGGIIGSISLHTIIKYNKKLKALYNLSLYSDYNSGYNRFILSYKF